MCIYIYIYIYIYIAAVFEKNVEINTFLQSGYDVK